jgi:hypothetical protein
MAQRDHGQADGLLAIGPGPEMGAGLVFFPGGLLAEFRPSSRERRLFRQEDARPPSQEQEENRAVRGKFASLVYSAPGGGPGPGYWRGLLSAPGRRVRFNP